ncbi:DMT family transporter [Gloeobacter violaceus]|uniref:DMT family transporter n=1 Tax=Gloeobacter violaceus TaxID=33072 RepID=UPI0013E8DE46|nr:DMT family transporter [Gloeobacter violaceus]
MAKIPGQLYLWVAVAIFAASGAVTKQLTELGTQHPIDGRNPISFCNLLFVGNLCALLVLIPLYRKQLSPAILRQFSRGDWLGMVAVALLAGALAPALILIALSQTMINDVTLVGRLEPLLTLALSAWWLRERPTPWQTTGAAVCFLGVIVTVTLQGVSAGGMAALHLSTTGRGEWLTAFGAVALALANIISRARLGRIPIGTFAVVRTTLGTVIFFGIALYLFGSHHFVDAFSPFLWEWMLLYGMLIVVVGQSLWLLGLKRAGSAQAAVIQAFHPLGAILAAYWLLGEAPTPAQYAGGGIILFGIALSLVGSGRTTAPPPGAGMGFKGW